MEPRIIAIVQARMGSTRFPGKVLKKIDGLTLIEILLNRLSMCQEIDQIILATTKKKEDQVLSEVVEKLGYPVYRGSENNVLSRYYEVAKKYNAIDIIRITGDCPLVDPELVGAVIKHYKISKADYTSNTRPPTYPDGLDIEVFSFKALCLAFEKANSNYEREHVTTFFKRNRSIKCSSISYKDDLSSFRWTVDEHDDFLVIKNIFKYFYPSLFDWGRTKIVEKRKKNNSWWQYAFFKKSRNVFT